MSLRTTIFLLALLLSGCGQFATYPYYAEDAAESEDAVSCDVMRQPRLQALTEVQVAVHEPLWWRIVETALEPAVPLSFEILEGELPPGLFLNAETGTISGFPSEAGSFDVTIGTGPNPAYDPCVNAASIQLTVTVTQPCPNNNECASRASPPDPAATCEDPGRCLFSNEAGICPAALEHEVSFNLGGAPEPFAGRSFEVLAHHPLSKEDLATPGFAGFSHQMLLGGDDDLVWAFPYRLAHPWPLPYQVGERVQFRVEQETPELVVVDRESGDLTTYLFNGPPSPPLEAEDGPLPVPLSRRTLSCSMAGHQCGPRNHDDLTFGVGDYALLASSGEEVDTSFGGAPYSLRVATAYSHLPLQFECPYLAPVWASFDLFPLASCPVAIIDEIATSSVLWSAEETIPVLLDGSSSLAHEGASISSYQWRLTRQPYAGLVELTDPGAGKGTSKDWFALLPASAAGLYNIELEVTDSNGGASCAAALAQLNAQVPPDLDLRIELVWWTVDDKLAVNDSLELLLMHPTYAKLLGESPWDTSSWTDGAALKWVCGASNPNPSNWAALPDATDGLCRTSSGNLKAGRPEVITVASLDRDQKTNRYPVAVHSPEASKDVLYAGLRVFINGLPRYETSKHAILPGQTWQAGHVDVEFMKFVPEKNGK